MSPILFVPLFKGKKGLPQRSRAVPVASCDLGTYDWTRFSAKR
jgi:hypothetical protein